MYLYRSYRIKHNSVLPNYFAVSMVLFHIPHLLKNSIFNRKRLTYLENEPITAWGKDRAKG